MKHKNFESISHTADIQLRVYGTSPAELFKYALIGMFQSIGPIGPHCKKVDDRVTCTSLTINHEVTVTAPDQETLLVDFLSEALALSDIHNEAYLDATIHEITKTHIKATLHGTPITGFEVVEIKAVTYHNLHIKQIDGIWQTDIVFDI